MVFDRPLQEPAMMTFAMHVFLVQSYEKVDNTLQIEWPREATLEQRDVVISAINQSLLLLSRE